MKVQQYQLYYLLKLHNSWWLFCILYIKTAQLQWLFSILWKNCSFCILLPIFNIFYLLCLYTVSLYLLLYLFSFLYIYVYVYMYACSQLMHMVCVCLLSFFPFLSQHLFPILFIHIFIFFFFSFFAFFQYLYILFDNSYRYMLVKEHISYIRIYFTFHGSYPQFYYLHRVVIIIILLPLFYYHYYYYYYYYYILFAVLNLISLVIFIFLYSWLQFL